MLFRSVSSARTPTGAGLRHQLQLLVIFIRTPTGAELRSDFAYGSQTLVASLRVEEKFQAKKKKEGDGPISDDWKTNSVQGAENSVTAGIGALIRNPSFQGSFRRKSKVGQLPQGDRSSDLRAQILRGTPSPDGPQASLQPLTERMGRYDGNRVSSNDAKIEKELDKR